MMYNLRGKDLFVRTREGTEKGKTMENEYVNNETLIGEIVRNYPESIEVLLSIGMHCLGCPASQAESLQDACAVHGIPADGVVKAINEKIAAARA